MVSKLSQCRTQRTPLTPSSLLEWGILRILRQIWSFWVIKLPSSLEGTLNHCRALRMETKNATWWSTWQDSAQAPWSKGRSCRKKRVTNANMWLDSCAKCHFMSLVLDGERTIISSGNRFSIPGSVIIWCQLCLLHRFYETESPIWQRRDSRSRKMKGC